MNILPHSFKHFALAAIVASQLTGCAAAIVGGAAAGADFIVDRRTTGTQLDDEKLELRIKKNATTLIKQNHPNSRATLSVISYNRKVLLMGQVSDENERILAEQAARQESGVQNVYNHIQINPTIRSIGQINYDTWVTSKVRSRLLTLATSGVYAGHVKVATFNNITYVMGLLTPQQQQVVINSVRNTTGVQQVVTLFEPYPTTNTN